MNNTTRAVQSSNVRFTFVALFITLNYSFYSTNILGVSLGMLTQAIFVGYILLTFRPSRSPISLNWTYVAAFFVYALVNTTITRKVEGIQGFSFILDGIFYIALLVNLRYRISLNSFIKIVCTIIVIQASIAYLELAAGQTFFTSWRNDRTFELFGLTLVQVGSTAEDPNYLALNYLPVIPLILYIHNITNKKTQNNLYKIVILLLCFLPILSEARTAFIVIITMAIMLKFKSEITKSALAIFTILCIGIFSLSYVLFNNSQYKLVRDFLETDGSSRDRTTALIGSINAFLSHPVIGVGSGNITKFTLTLNSETLYKETTLTSLNGYWGILSEFGIIGFALISIIIYNCFANLKNFSKLQQNRIGPITALYITIGLLSYLLMTFTLDGFFKPMFWVIVCLCFSLDSSSNLNQNINAKNRSKGRNNNLSSSH